MKWALVLDKCNLSHFLTCNTIIHSSVRQKKVGRARLMKVNTAHRRYNCINIRKNKIRKIRKNIIKFANWYLIKVTYVEYGFIHPRGSKVVYFVRLKKVGRVRLMVKSISHTRKPTRKFYSSLSPWISQGTNKIMGRRIMQFDNAVCWDEK